MGDGPGHAHVEMASGHVHVPTGYRTLETQVLIPALSARANRQHACGRCAVAPRRAACTAHAGALTHTHACTRKRMHARAHARAHTQTHSGGSACRQPKAVKLLQCCLRLMCVPYMYAFYVKQRREQYLQRAHLQQYRLRQRSQAATQTRPATAAGTMNGHAREAPILPIIECCHVCMHACMYRSDG